MRVLVLTNMYPTTEKPWFGIFVAEQVEDLGGVGVDTDVLSFDGTRNRFEYLRARRALGRRLSAGDVDLVHAHYGLTGAVAVSRRSRPVVTTFHGGDYTGLTRWHAAVSRLVARRCTPVVVSPEGARRLGCPRAHVIPAGVDTERFVPRDRVESRRALGWEVQPPYALLLGARGLQNKRADLFDAGVALARETVPELRAMSLEGFSRDEVVLVMNAVDVAVMCSDTEGSPVAVREALACCTPVVGVPVGDVAGVLDGLPGCAVVERSPRALAEGIVAALSAARAPELRERAESTSRRAVAARLVALYDEILAGHA